MSTLKNVLDQLRENQPKGKYGIAFEKLMVNFYRTDPVMKSQFDQVVRWEDWRYNGGKTDSGIDLVARRIHDLECVDPGVQLPGVNQAPQDVVVEVAEPQGGPP